MDKMNNSERQPGAGKKTYRTPELSLYGDVTQITRGASGASGDGGKAGNSRIPCWIAEVLYGVDAPRTHLVRAWLRECYDRRDSWALVVVPLYRHFGEAVASAVASHALLRRLFVPLFDRAVVCAHRDYAPSVVLASRAA